MPRCHLHLHVRALQHWALAKRIVFRSVLPFDEPLLDA
jgi:hypothetical protein